MSTYKASLDFRAEGLYKCATTTLASRELLVRAGDRFNMCKSHLVKIVSDRNAAEVDMERLSALSAKDWNADDMRALAAQLDRVGHFLDDESSVKRVVFGHL